MAIGSSDCWAQWAYLLERAKYSLERKGFCDTFSGQKLNPLERPKLGSSGKHTVIHFELSLLCFLWFYLLNLKPILQGIILDKNKPPKCSQNPKIVQFTFHIESTREQSISYIKILNKNPFEQRNGYLT